MDIGHECKITLMARVPPSFVVGFSYSTKKTISSHGSLGPAMESSCVLNLCDYKKCKISKNIPFWPSLDNITICIEVFAMVPTCAHGSVAFTFYFRFPSTRVT